VLERRWAVAAEANDAMVVQQASEPASVVLCEHRGIDDTPAVAAEASNGSTRRVVPKHSRNGRGCSVPGAARSRRSCREAKEEGNEDTFRRNVLDALEWLASSQQALQQTLLRVEHVLVSASSQAEDAAAPSAKSVAATHAAPPPLRPVKRPSRSSIVRWQQSGSVMTPGSTEQGPPVDHVPTPMVQEHSSCKRMSSINVWTSQMGRGSVVTTMGGALPDLAFSPIMMTHCDTEEGETLSRASTSWPWLLRKDWPRSLAVRNEGHTANEDLLDFAVVKSVRDAMKFADLEDPNELCDERNPSRSLTLAGMRVRRRICCGCSVGFSPMSPVSPLRLLIDFLGVLSLLFDLITIPVMIAWDLPHTGKLRDMATGVACFWTFDMVTSFFTGFYSSSGEVEMKFHLIAKRYLMSWFPIDATIIGLDCSTILLSYVSGEAQGTSGTGLLRLAKASRMLRVVAVLRCARFTDIITRMLQRNLPSGFRILLQIAELFMTILYVNHVIACIWYYLGLHAPSDTGHSWLAVPIGGFGGQTYGDAEFWYQYLTAMHWAMSQMTPGSMQVVPVNTIERAFNVACLMSGVIFFGSLISTLSSKMLHYRMTRQDMHSKISVLHRFLSEKGVSPGLTLTIKRQIADRLKVEKPLAANDVHVLSVLSKKTRAQLQCEICKPYLSGNPFLQLSLSLDQTLLNRICSTKALDFCALAPGDILFEAASMANSMYAVSQGTLTYVRDPTTSFVTGRTEEIVEPLRWLCEPAMFVDWVHVGTVEAISVCEVLTIEVEQILESANMGHVTKRLACEYAKLYHKIVTNTPQVILPELSDISIPNVSHIDIISRLPMDVRCALGRHCLTMMQDSWAWVLKKNRLLELAQEIENAQSTLFVDADEEIQRLVTVVSVQITQGGHGLQEERTLVEIGKSDMRSMTMTPILQLPGTKPNIGETPADTVRRLLKEELLPLNAAIQLGDFHTQLDHSISAKYSLKTTYQKHIQCANLMPNATLPKLQSVDSMRLVRELTTSSAAHLSADRDLCLGEVMLLTNGKRKYLLAWLTEEQFNYFGTPSGGAVLSNLVSSINITDEMVQDANELFRAARRSEATGTEMRPVL